MKYSAGEQIYKYELLSYIGGGEFGEVWLTKDFALDLPCALKILPRNDISIDERLLEAQIGCRLQHSNVVNIKYADVLEYKSEPVVTIAMPYYKSGSMLSQLNSNNFLDIKIATKCLIDILRGLEYLHENGYFHCDIKPNNILVGDSGESILTDYGITCYSPTHVAVHPRQCYLPHTSPETLSKNIYDERTDIYQLGLTAFRLLNGISEIRSEFMSDRNAFQKNVLAGKVIVDNKYQPFVPRKIKRIISKATALNPDDRYQSALEMRRALEQLVLKGNCTSDATGNIQFIVDGNSYRYEVLPSTDKLSDFVVFKKNLKSGRETKVKQYCKKGIKNSEVKKSINVLANDLL